jgi:hypothetical protein
MILLGLIHIFIQILLLLAADHKTPDLHRELVLLAVVDLLLAGYSLLELLLCLSGGEQRLNGVELQPHPLWTDPCTC